MKDNSEQKTIDELIDDRVKSRAENDFKKSDAIRDYLDTQLVFIFDGVNGQEIYYLTKKYFAKKPEGTSNRKYLEQRILKDIRAQKIFEAWLFTTTQSLKVTRQNCR